MVTITDSEHKQVQDLHYPVKESGMQVEVFHKVNNKLVTYKDYLTSIKSARENKEAFKLNKLVDTEISYPNGYRKQTARVTHKISTY